MDVLRKEGPVLLTECEVEVSFLINVAMFSVHALAFALVLVMASRLLVVSCVDDDAAVFGFPRLQHTTIQQQIFTFRLSISFRL